MNIKNIFDSNGSKAFLWLAGIIFIIYAIGWYRDKNNKPYDWCFNLSPEKSSYCIDLYWQSVNAQKKFYEENGDSHGTEEDDDGFR